jgi:hypothetical protein
MCVESHLKSGFSSKSSSAKKKRNHFENSENIKYDDDGTIRAPKQGKLD